MAVYTKEEFQEKFGKVTDDELVSLLEKVIDDSRGPTWKYDGETEYQEMDISPRLAALNIVDYLRTR
jgi:hypothetical protein